MNNYIVIKKNDKFRFLNIIIFTKYSINLPIYFHVGLDADW